MNNQKGNTSMIVAIVGLVIVAVAGYFMYSSTRPKAEIKDESMMVAENTDKVDETMMEDESSKTDEGMMSEYAGTILAGTKTPFIVFNEADYKKAKDEGKIIILDFYANWCPICRAEAPDIEAGFNELNNENVVGFRVNYNDTETDEVEKALAKEFGVTYQHTKVILKEGVQVLKDGQIWDTEMFIEQVNSVL